MGDTWLHYSSLLTTTATYAPGMIIKRWTDNRQAGHLLQYANYYRRTVDAPPRPLFFLHSSSSPAG
eukprot:4817562-Pyramimonas_sp.AAC.1